METWVHRYVGIPYENGGRGESCGLDCWGLVRKVLDEQYGLALPTFEGVAYSAEHVGAVGDEIERRIPLVNAHLVEKAETGDIVLMTSRGYPIHVGVYVGDGMILHNEPKKGTVLSRAAAPDVAIRIRGYYRVDQDHRLPAPVHV